MNSRNAAPRIISGAMAGAFLALALAIPPLPAAESVQREAPEPGTRTIAFDTDEITDAQVDVAPDGSRIVFDLLGDLYVVPISGGTAQPLTQGSAWDARPRFSPDGKQLAFVSDRSGAASRWVMQLDTGAIKEVVPRGDYWSNQQAPVWTDHGSLLVVTPPTSEPAISGGRFVYKPIFSEVDGAGRTQAANPFLDSYSEGGSFSLDGRYVYSGGSVLRRTDLQTGEHTDLVKPAEQISIGQPRISRDGRRLAYRTVQSSATDETCSLRVLELATGVDREVLADFCGAGAVAFTPDGAALILGLRGKIMRVDLAGGPPSELPVRVQVRRELAPLARQAGRRIEEGGEVRSKVIRWPTRAASGSDIVFDAFAKIYSSKPGDAKPHRVTQDSASEFSPALSPDGKWIAYTTWSDVGLGQVMVIAASGGRPRRLTSVPGRYINPAWSPDGSRVVFLSMDSQEERQGQRPTFTGPVTGQWMFSVNWVLARDAGTAHPVNRVSPIAVMDNRLHPVPSFSADGRRIIVATYRLDDGSQPSGPLLISMGLDGKDIRTLAKLPPADEIVVSPDARQVAIVWQGSLYLAKLPDEAQASEIPTIDPARAVAVTRGAIGHVSWRDAATLVWASADRVFQFRIGDREPTLQARLDVRQPRAEPKGCFVLAHARLVTMRANDVIEDGSVLVCGNRIVAAGAAASVSIPKGARNIDVRGSTIIPGLVDVHSHTTLNVPLEVWQQQNLNLVGNLAFGVTTLYDPSAPTLDTFGQAELLETGDMLGPRLYSSGLPLLPVAANVSNSRPMRSLSDAETAVQSVASYGAGPVKEYTYPRRDQIHWLARAAREQGVSITTHSYPSLIDYLTHISEGYTGLEHLIANKPIYGDIVQFLAASGTNYTPTLMVSPGYGTEFTLATDFDSARLRHLFSPQFLERERQTNTQPALKPYMEARARELVKASESLARIVRAGGLVSIGAHGNGVPGLASHWEMWAFTEGGMGNLEALRAATLNGARKLDLDRDLGSIEAGKVADFIVLNSNPLENIRNSVDIRYVVKNGFVFDEAMTRVWPTRKPLAPWPWQTNPNTTHPESTP